MQKFMQLRASSAEHVPSSFILLLVCFYEGTHQTVLAADAKARANLKDNAHTAMHICSSSHLQHHCKAADPNDAIDKTSKRIRGR